MSVEIKTTIGLLCKLLNLRYETDLKPEHFRIAKFNKSDENVIPALWGALLTVLQESSTAEAQKRLHNLNYNRREFYVKECAGSRELLLALAFLLSVTLERDIKQALDNIPVPEWIGQSNTNKHEGFNWAKLTKHDLQNYKNWLSGKTSRNNKLALEYEEQTDKIANKYSKSLDFKGCSPLTVHEILALKSKKVGDIYLQNTERIAKIMSVYSEWIKKEKIFWKWMGSVLAEAAK